MTPPRRDPNRPTPPPLVIRPVVPLPPTERCPPPVWSKQPPQAPGLYHYRATDVGRPGRACLVAVREGPDARLIARFAHGERWVDELTGEWAGPIDNPGT